MNGNPARKSTGSFAIPGNPYPLSIGAAYRGTQYHFKGVIEDVKIYSGAKSAEDILMSSFGCNPAVCVDGKLDEPVWKDAKVFKDFFCMQTREKSGIGTKAFITYDQDFLYIGIECEEPLIHALKDNVRRNNIEVYKDDSIEIMLDAGGARPTITIL